MFDILNDIMYNKTGQYLNDSATMEEFSPYMIQRWISMYSERTVDFLNSSINISYKVLDDVEVYKLLLTTLPKYKYKRIAYIKSGGKSGSDKQKDEIRYFIEDNRAKLDNSLSFVFGDGKHVATIGNTEGGSRSIGEG